MHVPKNGKAIGTFKTAILVNRIRRKKTGQQKQG